MIRIKFHLLVISILLSTYFTYFKQPNSNNTKENQSINRRLSLIEIEAVKDKIYGLEYREYYIKLTKLTALDIIKQNENVKRVIENIGPKDAVSVTVKVTLLQDFLLIGESEGYSLINEVPIASLVNFPINKKLIEKIKAKSKPTPGKATVRSTTANCEPISCETNPKQCKCPTYAANNPCICTPNICACCTFYVENTCFCQNTENTCDCESYAKANPCECAPNTCSCPTYASANPCICSPCSCPSYVAANPGECLGYIDPCDSTQIAIICPNRMLRFLEQWKEDEKKDLREKEENRNLQSFVSKVDPNNYYIPWGVRAVYNELNGVTPLNKGAGVKVAIIDTGIDQTHPDLAHKVFSDQYFNWTGDGSFHDYLGHGTHVAGTVLADGYYIGTAHLANLQIHKVIDSSGSGSFSWIDQALNIACNDPSVNIVTMSLGASGYEYDSSYSTEYNFQTCLDNGKLITVSAGNEDTYYNYIGYPASSPKVMAIGALVREIDTGTCTENHYLDNYSSVPVGHNSESWCTSTTKISLVEISMPGTDIKSTYSSTAYPYGMQYYTLSGTSMATPHAAGLAAAIWSQSLSLGLCPTGTTIRKILQQKAKNCDIIYRKNYWWESGQYTRTGYDSASGFGFPRFQDT